MVVYDLLRLLRNLVEGLEFGYHLCRSSADTDKSSCLSPYSKQTQIRLVSYEIGKNFFTLIRFGIICEAAFSILTHSSLSSAFLILIEFGSTNWIHLGIDKIRFKKNWSILLYCTEYLSRWLIVPCAQSDIIACDCLTWYCTVAQYKWRCIIERCSGPLPAFDSFIFAVNTVRCSGHEKIDVSRSEHSEHLKGSSVELVHNPESKRFKANFYWTNLEFRLG